MMQALRGWGKTLRDALQTGKLVNYRGKPSDLNNYILAKGPPVTQAAPADLPLLTHLVRLLLSPHAKTGAHASFCISISKRSR